MILSDFLLQQKNDNSDPSEIIPISFNAYNILEESRNSGMCKRHEGKFLIQTCSQARMSCTTLQEVHGVRKELDPNLRPEKQHALPKKGETERPHIGQGRAGLRRKPEVDCINQPSDVTRRILERSKIATGKINNPQHTSAVCDRGINNDKQVICIAITLKTYINTYHKLPHSKLVKKKLEALSERYVLLDSLLYIINPEKENSSFSYTRRMCR